MRCFVSQEHYFKSCTVYYLHRFIHFDFNQYVNCLHWFILTIYTELLIFVNEVLYIFKVGRRDTLINAVAIVWGDISVLIKSSISVRSSLLRKFTMKLSQRIALACLPHRSSSWQYMVGLYHVLIFKLYLLIFGHN